MILKRTADCPNKYLKFVGIDEFLNGTFKLNLFPLGLLAQIFALNQIKTILPLNICLLVYNALLRPHIEYGIISGGGGA